MSLCQEDLDKLCALHNDANQARTAADSLTHKRNAFILELTSAGATRADIAEALDLTRARAQQFVDAGRRAAQT